MVYVWGLCRTHGKLPSVLAEEIVDSGKSLVSTSGGFWSFSFLCLAKVEEEICMH